MAKDFSTKKGAVQPNAALAAEPRGDGGTPSTGFDEAPRADVCFGEPGSGVGNSRGGIR